MKQIRAAASIVCAFAFAHGAQAQTAYPVKPVRIIVPVAPGGSVDAQARLFSRRISEETNQSFIIENRPMAGGAAAFASVAKAIPDGYTLLAVSPTLALAPATGGAVDPVKDFAHISLVAKAPYLLVVNPSVPVKSAKEFIALAKSRPGTVNFGGTPTGNIVHLAALWLFSMANIKVTYVPYKGTGPSMIAAVSGEVDAVMGSVVGIMPFVKSGKVRALAVTTGQRSKFLPDIPTLAEQGVPGYDFSTFHGWVAPAGTPSPIINQLNLHLKHAVYHPEVMKILTPDGVEPVASTPEQFRDLIASEVVRWKKIVKENNIKVE